MKVAILGYGKQGKSAYEYWSKKGADITICDRSTDLELPFDVHTHLGDDYLQSLDQFDVIVRSPSVHPNEILSNNFPGVVEKITTVTNEFFAVSPSKHIIAVTGTKGKGTTTTLITKMLEAAGYKVHIGGNIGTPPLDLLLENIEANDFIVLELANFQLIDLKYSPPYALCLMVVPEHLDWHKDVDEYYDSKKQLFLHQTEQDIAIFNEYNEMSKKIASVGKGQKIPYMVPPGCQVLHDMFSIADTPICAVNELKLLGEHNQQNACAAITTVWQITQNVQAIAGVLKTFSGLPHRLEHVGTIKEIDFYDDSFGTTPETSIVAIKAFTRPKVLILGGYNKGADYDALADVIAANNVDRVVLIGEQAGRIRMSLEKAGVIDMVKGGETMTDIVKTAKAVARPGDIVLLSPACASFDMFKNYEDRGDQFKEAVQALVSTVQ